MALFQSEKYPFLQHRLFDIDFFSEYDFTGLFGVTHFNFEYRVLRYKWSGQVSAPGNRQAA